ncbi:hypothetical protein ACO0LL_23065 [Undibacterium sp. TC4M20W]|uniref:hypothetical protein n=1 Tax=unclassified Undibacterium TaxID=2630295 RepID=UPI003BF3B05E
MQTIPHIKKEDLERWEKILSKISPKVLAAINSGLLQDGRLLALHLRNSLNLGALAYASGDFKGFLAAYHETLLRFQLFFDDRYFSQVNAKYVYETSEEILCVSLILNESRTPNLARDILSFTVQQSDSRVEFISAIAALLQDEKDSARKLTLRLIKNSSLSFGQFLPQALLAIINDDLNLFLIAIAGATAEFDEHISAEGKGTPEAAIFLRGAALLRLFERVNHKEINKTTFDPRLLPNI